MGRNRLYLITPPALVLLIISAASAAPKFKVLHAFGNGQDGAGTWGSLVLDKNGNLYGTTGGGGGTSCNGQTGCGTVFEITPVGKNNWGERILYRFEGTPDGEAPFGSLALGYGTLYGTTAYGGIHDYGTVFELVSGGDGWTERVLYSFGTHNNDGFEPYAGVVVDAQGNLFGTTPHDPGNAFELVFGPDGWTETVIDDFPRPHDGNGPFAGVVLGHDNSLYGTTEYGGKHNLGVVYRLTLGNGGWKEQILHDFCPNGPPNCPDGATPGVGSSLAKDSDGNLYGTTVGGGCCGGVIFKLSPEANGRWKEAVLYEFQGGPLGEGPGAGVVRDKSGNLYGTTIYGGSTNCDCGVVYKLAPQKNGKWKYTVLHTFVGSDGAQPDANLIIDDRGNLYGTAATGGQYNAGVAFEVTP